MSRHGILLIRLKSIGDIVFTLPAVHALRQTAPSARITFVVSKEYGPLLQGFKDVDTTLELDRAKYKGLHPIKVLGETLRVIKQIRRSSPELAIDFQGYGETALLTWASRAPHRVGTLYRPGRKWAYTKAVARNLDIHPAADCLALLKQNGIDAPVVRNEFVLPEEGRLGAESFIQANGVQQDQRMLFIQPLTSSAHKDWPLERYLQIGGIWRSQGWQVIFGGGPEDQRALAKAKTAGYLVSAGVSLLASAGLMARSTLVLGGDTGLVHLAVALGKRVIMVMRSVRKGSCHPFQHENWAVGPQAEGLVNSISTEAVNQHCRQACAELGINPEVGLTSTT
jgi:ADP-heptose:LPS heptosyltransferase